MAMKDITPSHPSIKLHMSVFSDGIFLGDRQMTSASRNAGGVELLWGCLGSEQNSWLACLWMDEPWKTSLSSSQAVTLACDGALPREADEVENLSLWLSVVSTKILTASELS